MNREILFKAKTKQKDSGEFDNVWVIGNLIVSGEKYYIHPAGNIVSVVNELGRLVVMHEVIPETICQYTGLNDKYGNKIWENDIVTVPRDEEPCLIVWDEYCARWGMTQYGSYMYDFDNFDGVELEAIGNIFDNPDFLGGGAEE